VQNVSFSVGRGEIVCLVGESGSGKSVIAHSVMGCCRRPCRCAAVRSVLQGEDITRAPAHRLRELRATRMSMIFQEPMTALNPVMTCGDQIDEVLREHTQLSAGQRRAKVLAIVREVLLPEPERMVGQLSAPALRRPAPAHHDRDGVGARAGAADRRRANHRARCDHAGADPQLVLQLQARHGTGVLFITHDFGVVAELAHRVAVLRLGDLVEVGSKHEVLQQPRHDYTRMLIGAVPTLKLQQRTVDATAPLVLRTQRLNKTYFGGGWFGKRRSVHAAQDVNLEIRRGQTLGIVGESGSGKSTVRAASCA
jgi:peptide/nickel transport system ATP-binding protein